MGVGADGMALPPGSDVAPVAPPTPPASECNDLEFTLDNVDKVCVKINLLQYASCCDLFFKTLRLLRSRRCPSSGGPDGQRS